MFHSRSRLLASILFVALTTTLACSDDPSVDPAPVPDVNIGESDAGMDTGGDDVSTNDASSGTDTGADTRTGTDTGPGPDVTSAPDASEADVVEDTGGDVTPFEPTQQCNPNFGAAEACGGSPVGSWEIDNVCTDVDIEGQIAAFCAGTTVTRLDIRTSGTVVYTETTYSTDLSGFAEVDLTVPSSLCTILGCEAIAGQIESNLPDSQATCASGAEGACDCTARLTLSVVESGTYVLNSESGLITYDNGDTYHYCVENGVLTQREFGEGVEFEVTQVFTAQ